METFFQAKKMNHDTGILYNAAHRKKGAHNDHSKTENTAAAASLHAGYKKR